jgi:hypothetical protein
MLQKHQILKRYRWEKMSATPDPNLRWEVNSVSQWNVTFTAGGTHQRYFYMDANNCFKLCGTILHMESISLVGALSFTTVPDLPH